MGKYRKKTVKKVIEDDDFDFDMSLYKRDESEIVDESSITEKKVPRISKFRFKFTPYELSAFVLSDILKEMVKYGISVGSYSDDMNDLKKLHACMLQYYYLLRPFLGSVARTYFNDMFSAVSEDMKKCKVGGEIDPKINDKLLFLEMEIINCSQMKGGLFLHDVRSTGLRSNAQEKIMH